MIKREPYLNRLIRNMWNSEIKVITGIRRCGKSVLLFDLFYEYLLSQGVNEDHILKIELDQRRYYKYRNPIVLCEYVENTIKERNDEKFYLFIDEVQLTAKVVDRGNGDIEVTIYEMLNELKAYKNLDVYVTGSNSKGLSKDIATEFRGRATQIHVFPLSFAEFYSAVGGDERKALDTYGPSEFSFRATNAATRKARVFPVPTSASLIETRSCVNPLYICFANRICSSRIAYP